MTAINLTFGTATLQHLVFTFVPYCDHLVLLSVPHQDRIWSHIWHCIAKAFGLTFGTTSRPHLVSAVPNDCIWSQWLVGLIIWKFSLHLPHLLNSWLKILISECVLETSQIFRTLFGKNNKFFISEGENRLILPHSGIKKLKRNMEEWKRKKVEKQILSWIGCELGNPVWPVFSFTPLHLFLVTLKYENFKTARSLFVQFFPPKLVHIKQRC